MVKVQPTGHRGRTATGSARNGDAAVQNHISTTFAIRERG